MFEIRIPVKNMKKIIPISIMAAFVVATPISGVLASDYTVKSGDTLWGIATKSNTTVQNLMTWNDMKSSNLSIGQKLNTSKPVTKPTSGSAVSGSTHTVKSGETLWAISTKYKVSVADLTKWNSLKSTTLLIGQKLNVGNVVVSNKERMTLLSGLFKSPGKDRVSSITPQTVTVLERETDGWLKVQTWLGPLWTKNGVMAETKVPDLVNTETLVLGKTSGLFKSPGKDRVSSLNPQRVTVLERGTDGWFKINTWLGPLWTKDGVMADANAVQTATAKTTTSLNLRSAATVSGNVLTVIPQNSSVKVLSKAAIWWKIEYGGKTGYASSHYLKEDVKVATPAPAPVVQEKVKTTANLYFRETASPTGKAISILSQGTILTVVSKGDIWWKVSYGGKTGYVSSKYVTSATASAGTNGKIVVLDPGHGGGDPGAVNGSSYEKTVVLAHSLKVKTYLEQLGYTVHMTRTSDTSCVAAQNMGSGSSRELDCRVKFATAKKADVFVSVHANASIPGIRGTETFYNNGSVWNGVRNPQPALSGKLASAVHAKYQPAFASNNRGVKTANFYVNNNAKMPSILLEIGFMSDIRDLNKMKDPAMQNKVSKAIADGIDNYFK